MGFFRNVQNIKDKSLSDERFKDLNRDEFQGLFDIIDKHAEKERDIDRKEREYFEKLTPSQKIEYNRQRRQKHELKRLGAYGLYGATFAAGGPIPVMMLYGVSNILSSDSLTYDEELHQAKLKSAERKTGNKPKPGNVKGKKKPRKYLSISYGENGLPVVNTLVDKDPYNIKNRYKSLMKDYEQSLLEETK